jgi:copper chaperone CopZ
MATSKIYIGGMMCSHCVRRITMALESVESLKNVKVDLDTSSATFDTDKDIDKQIIKKALEEEGYSLKKVADN